MLFAPTQPSLVLALSVILAAAGPHQASPPVTAGGLALLAGQPDATDAVRQALTSPDPLVRAVAARVIGLRRGSALAEDVAMALGAETNAYAEAEMVRALLFIRGAAAIEPLSVRMERAQPQAVTVFANWIARMQADQLAARIPALANRAGSTAEILKPSITRTMQARPELAGAILRAWLGVASPAAWRSVIRHRALDLSAEAQVAVVRQALTAPNTEVREATVWMLLSRISGGQTVPPALLEAAADLADAPAAELSTLSWEAFGRELIGRQIGRSTPDRSAFITSFAKQHLADSRSVIGLRGIRPPEAAALRSQLGDLFRNPETLRQTSALVEPNPSEAMRTLPAMWPGFFGSLVSASGCHLSSAPLFAAMRTTYTEDGRAAQAQLAPAPVSAECGKVVDTVARLLIADPDGPPVGPKGEWVLIPMDTAYLACSEQSGGPDAEQPRIIGDDDRLKPPAKIRDLRPIYPADMQRARVQGAVIVEGVISTTGCPVALRVIKGVQPALDAAAVRAVSGWRFTSTELNGKPVPVIVTVTLTFRVQ